MQLDPDFTYGQLRDLLKEIYREQDTPTRLILVMDLSFTIPLRKNINIIIILVTIHCLRKHFLS